MAQQTIKNGQQITAPSIETEVLIQKPYGREVFFFVTSGTVQVTTAARGGTGVIGGEIHAFATADGLNRMTVEPADGATSEGKSIYVKGTGTIYFTW